MKSLAIFTIVPVVLCAGSLLGLEAAAPNIVLIISDDQSYGDF